MNWKWEEMDFQPSLGTTARTALALENAFQAAFNLREPPEITPDVEVVVTSLL